MYQTDDQPCADCGHPDNHSPIVGCLADHCLCEAFVSAPPELKVGETIPSRNADPETSKAAAKVAPVKKNTQRARLLSAFAVGRMDYDAAGSPDHGLTDEQAMEAAYGVSPFSEYAKRCSELRAAGLIEPTGETRAGGQGVPRIVSRITDAGRAVLASL